MKPLSWDKQLGLASPRESAASQSDQTNHPSKNEVRTGGAGCKSPRPHLSEGRGESFFLDILFNRMSVMAMFRQLSRINDRDSSATAAGLLRSLAADRVWP